jgi:hypothetical protein
MSLNIALLLLLMTFPESVVQETSTGIYLTIHSKKKDCPHLVYSRNKKIKVCATLKPIVTINDFKSVTEIKQDLAANVSYFNLVLSQEGNDRLKNLITSLAGTELVLVVDETVVGLIKNKDQLVNRSIRIDGPATSDDVTLVFNKLKQLLAEKK